MKLTGQKQKKQDSILQSCGQIKVQHQHQDYMNEQYISTESTIKELMLLLQWLLRKERTCGFTAPSQRKLLLYGVDSMVVLRMATAGQDDDLLLAQRQRTTVS